MSLGTVITNGYFLWSTTNLSTYITSMTINRTIAELNTTNMGDLTENMVGGLLGWEITLELNHDAAAVLDALLNTDLGVARAFEMRFSAAAASSTNPKYTATGAYFQYNPLPSGAVGELSKTSITIKPSGTTPNLTRATI